MKVNFYALLLSGLFAAGTASAQQTAPNYCGTTGISPWLEWYHTHKTELAEQRNDSDTSWIYAPVTVHLVGTNAGANYFRFDYAIRAVCEMNEKFAPAHIRFYLKPGDAVQYHANSSWYQHDWDGGSDMINSIVPGLEDRLNAFVVDDPAGNCGYSWQDAIVLAKSCSSSGNSTWSHEAGHHFSLPHPFVGWEGHDWNYSQPAPDDWDGHPVERTDLSNCYDAGDYFCDTRPDYLNYRWNCNDNSESNELQHDPAGNAFRSDGTLIMGYANDGCQSVFTPEQIEAMRFNLNTEHSIYQQAFAAGPEIDDEAAVELVSPIDSQVVQYNNFTVNWNPVPNADFYHVQVGMTPNFSIVLYNGTLTGATSITLTAGIPNNRTLWWRVRAYSNWDVCQPDNYDQIGVFKTHNFTATNELEQNLEAELAPNPVAGGLPAVLTVNAGQGQDAQLRVTDAAGRLCLEQSLRLAPGENRVDIPTASLQAGLYVVTLQNEKGAVVKRLAVAD